MLKRTHVQCPHCHGAGQIPIASTCAKCGGLYEMDYGCLSCGDGNPLVGIECLTPLAQAILAPAKKEAARDGE